MRSLKKNLLCFFEVREIPVTFPFIVIFTFYFDNYFKQHYNFFWECIMR